MIERPGTWQPICQKIEYGGSIQNRARFATEIITQVRENVGVDFVIGCRMGCNEPDLANSIKIAQELQNAGADLLHISFGMLFPSKNTKKMNNLKYRMVSIIIG